MVTLPSTMYTSKMVGFFSRGSGCHANWQHAFKSAHSPWVGSCSGLPIQEKAALPGASGLSCSCQPWEVCATSHLGLA